MSAAVERRVEARVLTIRMRRPEKKNAITREMYRAMADALAAADADDGVAAIVFCGVPGAFSAGNDIADFVAIAESGALPAEVRDFLHALAGVQKPLIAAVDGLAVGIGTTLLMHCDLAYASPGSIFRTPFLDLGVTPEAASSLIGPRLMGHQQAFALLVLGETFGAARAREAGLITQVVEDPEAAAGDAARRLGEKPAEALRIARALLRGAPDEIAARIDLELRYFGERLRSDEAQAAFRAFLAR
ncbi:crotonase/enoyl-CoA hydratase family protein [Aurantimonas sp. VKM B-3413]|uniref:crotonase/enoyl-CoA hydratase family protein n=1 Tax=Aurantimonas sp. VKM B-3413 TaxID=2779401 RepID=UPI001E65A617|nr:crotonase/enoyl-CoA hydratase family protein [Aurantimonas sp. VKM B-3413]MCB8838921.1 crotonase/enoyl-CoA hydratase family protein [Aurantimonas sp. VKM B-3413]